MPVALLSEVQSIGILCTMTSKSTGPATLTLDPSVPPTAEQLDEIARADPRFHQIFTMGGRVALSGGVVDGDERPVGFCLPSAPALFLSLSYRAHRSSERAFRSARFGDYTARLGEPAYTAMFDFFELRTQHVIFAFSALEAYANECIPDPFTWTTTRKRKGCEEEAVTHDREGVERYVGLAEKVDGILPKVFATESIKGRAPWEKFLKLRTIRDRLIHLKYFDSKVTPDPGGMPPEKNSVWADLFTSRAVDVSKQVHEIIMHYGGERRTWARKFPYVALAASTEEAIQRRLKNEQKSARRKGRVR